MIDHFELRYHDSSYLLGDPIYHSDDLWDIGWEDYLDRGGVCAVEWSENVEDAIYVTIHKTGEASRRIVIEGGENLADLSL